MTAVLRSWLYVPGHRADRITKALSCGADAVVVDLEDAVPPEQKATARAGARAALEARRGDHPQLWVRINDPGGRWGEADLDALAGSGVSGLRIPRAEDPELIRQVAERAGVPLQLLIESAAGLLRAAELAAAHPLVSGVGLGEADLAADLRLRSDSGLGWARGCVVVAARSAGLPPPVQSVWTAVDDLDGLRASSERGRALGFLGRSVIHPRQVPVVHEVFTPSDAEIAAANEVLRAAESAAAGGETAFIDATGGFVDPAVVERARVVLAVAAEHDRSQNPPHQRGER
ncbi:HpcH/HpaI aldolase/citrate lyase family protein [Pseudonocardia thermophila]|uniref:HpcH/HpaI aldolase/citrate lyase family protein n=1 Tax=Pseudonocardia thermophila TaxID=1848 RepID=UPI00248EAF25|nr:CoA ester lyase [Pseudonocardia thermophila]